MNITFIELFTLIIIIYFSRLFFKYRLRILVRLFPNKKNIEKMISKSLKIINGKTYSKKYKIDTFIYLSMLANIIEKKELINIYKQLTSFISNHRNDERVILSESLLLTAILNQSNNFNDEYLNRIHKLTKTIDVDFIEELLDDYSRETHELLVRLSLFYISCKDLEKYNNTLKIALNDRVLNQYPKYRQNIFKFLQGYYFVVQNKNSRANQIFGTIYKPLMNRPYPKHSILFIIEKNFGDEQLEKGNIEEAATYYKRALQRINKQDLPLVFQPLYDEAKGIIKGIKLEHL